VVVLTGQFEAGCTTVAEFLEREEGFKYYRFSSIIAEAAKEHLGPQAYDQLQPVERRTLLQDQGNILRQPDPAAIAKQLIEKIEAKGDAGADVVVEAVRNPAEIRAFRERFGDRAFVVALDAPLQVRFERSYGDYGDDLEQFKRDDARDKGEDEPEYGQRTEECVYLADISINNDAQLDSSTEWDMFFVTMREHLKLMREPAYRQPSLEELYMRQAYAISLRSSCTKRQVGAVLVSEIGPEEGGEGPSARQGTGRKESYVIATGCNDVPVGDLACRRQQEGPWGDPRFCPKDHEEERKLRAMKYCPGCGTQLAVPTGKITAFTCPQCEARLPRDFVPGRMLDVCRAVHAEEAAIVQAAKLGSTSLRAATLYSTTFPCLLCAKSIINAGIKRVVYHEPYPMDDTVKMLDRCGVRLEKYQGVNAWAFDRMFRGTLD
jgi:deoxycytidylate deaminase